MTDGLDQALVNAVLGLLRADASYNSVCPTYDGLVPDGAVPPYRQVYFNLLRPSDDPDNAADGRSRVWTLYTYVHNVAGGQDASGARAVAQRSRTQLLDQSPAVAGLSVGMLRLDDAQPPERDETTGKPVMDAVQTYRLRATS
jgi:hypothetical protein